MGKAIIYFTVLVIASLLTIGYFVLDNTRFADKYDNKITNEVSIRNNMPGYELKGYQSRVGILEPNTDLLKDQFVNDTYATLLINNETKTPIVSYNALRRIYPASTTKLMTGIVVCDALNDGEISLDEKVTLDSDVVIDEEGALVSELRAGCTITIRNLLYGLMMRSYNDYAIILAEYICGSQSAFVERMNNKAYAIGATSSHFCNPHGLHDDNHYITAYDMYLILQEAKKYEILHEIDSYNSFTYSYTDGDGYVWEDDISPTNEFLAGNYKTPSNITIKEWKTGTTDAAGYILTMNVDIDDKNFSLFVADGTSQDDLYDKIGILFNLSK